MKRLLLARFLTALSGLLFAMAASAKLFVPDLVPWDEWVAADESSGAVINHDSWQQLLNLYLITETADGINRFDYAAVMDADRERLSAYVQRLAALDPRLYNR
ncbi:MAG: hypothetical protein ACR2QG_04180, partial [Gammaproteobacteria bacterium]